MTDYHWNVRLNGNQLKLIAVISMLIDHSAVAFVGSESHLYWIMRGIGRIAFPIYAFLLAEGFFHTKNLKNYMLRLSVLAVLSEIPFDYLVSGNLIDPRSQNIFWTLLLGLFMMHCQKTVTIRCPGIVGRQLELFLIILFSAAAWIFRLDYDYRGIMLIGLFFWFYGEKTNQAVFGCIWMVLTQGISWIPLTIGYGLAFLLIYSYSGKRGSWNGKTFFYAFYPVHLMVLGVLRTLFQVFT